MYNEVKERRVKGKGERGENEETVEEVEKKKEGRQYLPRTGGIQMRSSLLPLCLHGEIFLQTIMAAGQPSFFSTFVGAQVPHPFLRISPPLSCTTASFVLVSLPTPLSSLRGPTFARKKGRFVAVYHRGLLLIVIKYSSTVTCGRILVTGLLARSLNEIRGSHLYCGYKTATTDWKIILNVLQRFKEMLYR